MLCDNYIGIYYENVKDYDKMKKYYMMMMSLERKQYLLMSELKAVKKENNIFYI